MTKISDQLNSFFWDTFLLLSVNGITGDYVEFGSWPGNTLKLAYQTIRDLGGTRHCWTFDSFIGLPEVTNPRDEMWTTRAGFVEGQDPISLEKFHANCAANGIPREAYTAVAGWYDDTLPAIGDGPPIDIALAYVDCNMYESTVRVLDFLAPRLKHGMVVAFDDYYLWSSRQVSSERFAFHEFVQAHPQWRFHRFRDVHYAALSFVVERADWTERP